MLSFFTVALIALFVAMTWLETPVEPLVRHTRPPEDLDAPSSAPDRIEREAA